MIALEDTMNLPQCGVLFMFLTIMCFGAFHLHVKILSSAITKRP